MKWVCFPKFYSLLGIWPWLRISPQSSLFVIYCLTLTAWQWLMSFTCIPVQTEPNKSPLRKRLLALLLWEIGNLSSSSRSCLGRLILIHGGWERWALQVEPPPTVQDSVENSMGRSDIDIQRKNTGSISQVGLFSTAEITWYFRKIYKYQKLPSLIQCHVLWESLFSVIVFTSELAERKGESAQRVSSGH